MSTTERPEIVTTVMTRVQDIKDFLSQHTKIEPDEELNCTAFFEASDGNPFGGRTTKEAVVKICAWIGTENADQLFSRPIELGIQYPEDWRVEQGEGRNSYVTYFDRYNLDVTQTNEIRNYRPGGMIFTADMYDHTSD